MNDVVAAYVRGRQEGYFNVRLDSSILDMNQQSRAFFAKGYHIGKKNRKIESINETKSQNNEYIENRKAYITIMGYKSACQGETVNSSLLKGVDKISFEDGYKVGLLHKNDKIDQINPESLETYLMITGFDITDESYSVYLDMLKDYSGLVFARGHKVSDICKGIYNSAIKELKDNQLNIFKKDLQR